MNNITTISALLHLSNSQYRIYDIGRKIEKISKENFKKLELNQLPYPTPSQGHAFIAVAFWQKESTQPYLWLLKLPLDERSLLNQGAIAHFVAIIVEALGSDLTKNPNKQQEELLKNNPYIFTPAQYKLAALNSKIKVDLKQPPSEHLSVFKTYLSHKLDWDNWQSLGVQGITDFAARINQNNHSQLLLESLPNLPKLVIQPLCIALENEKLETDLIQALLTLLSAELIADNSSIDVQQYILRSLSSSIHNKHVLEKLEEILLQASVATELLITLSGRCWLTLENERNMMLFLEHLISTQDISLFNAIFKDLVAIPSIRPIVFLCIRSPNRSKALTNAIGQLFT